MGNREDKPETFESALLKLEKIVRDIEEGKVGLEDSIKRYEEGMRLLGHCREILSKAPGVKVVDDPSKARYPLATDCERLDDTFVGRIRRDDTVSHGLNLWIVSDNLLKGAALNAVQIAERLVS